METHKQSIPGKRRAPAFRKTDIFSALKPMTSPEETSLLGLVKLNDQPQTRTLRTRQAKPSQKRWRCQ